MRPPSRDPGFPRYLLRRTGIGFFDRKCSGAELLPEALVDDLRVRLALRLAHYLADEEAEQAFLAAPVGLDLLLVLAQDPVDHWIELRGVGDCALTEVLLGCEAVRCAGRDGCIEGLARDLVAFAQNLGQLGTVDVRRVDARSDVVEHERRRGPGLDAGFAKRLEQAHPPQ